MGLFEEIGHAWFVVGSQLFLWNYSDTYVSTREWANGRRDFSRYDEQKELIESVGLVKAKRGMWLISQFELEYTLMVRRIHRRYHPRPSHLYPNNSDYTGYLSTR